jgi:hypothetical protein
LAERQGWSCATDLGATCDVVGGDRLEASRLGRSTRSGGVILRRDLRYLYGALT